MKRSSRPFLAVAAAAALAAAAAGTGAAHAASGSVAVSLVNYSPTRTLYVQDMLGNDLTTTGLNLGTTRSEPFQVKVVDQTMTPSAFTVQALMSNLYQCNGTGGSCSSLSSTQPVPSSQVSIDYPTSPLDVLGVSALVTPLLNFTEDVNVVDATLCATITAESSLGAGACSINLSGLTGLAQNLNETVSGVTAAALGGLPLVPQAGTPGAFTSPDYEGVAGQFAPSGWTSGSATKLPVLSGNTNLAASVLTTLTGQVATSPVSGSGAIIDQNVLASALSGALGTVVSGSSLGGPVWATLTQAQQTEIINNLTASLTNSPITTGEVTGLSGTYIAYPKLDVTVPTGTTSGTYQGTLVLTGF